MDSRQEHKAKYQALADTLGWDALRALMPLSIDKVRVMLANGDEHLNTYGNKPWDRVALGETEPSVWDKAPRCHSCGQRKPQELRKRVQDWPYGALRCTARDKALPWYRAPGLSLGERCCVLKHVAIVDAKDETRTGS